jgi:hypothetical protein
MKHTGEADALVPEFAARWTQEENISTNYIQQNTRKRKTGRG